MNRIIDKINMKVHELEGKLEILSENFQLMFYRKEDKNTVEELRIKCMELKFKENFLFSIRQSIISSYAGPIINQIRDISLPLSYEVITSISNIDAKTPKLVRKYVNEYQ